MAENVSGLGDGTPFLEKRLEMPQLVKALDRAIDDERWDRVEGLISRMHEMGMGMLERRKFVDIHHQVKELAKTLVVLSKRPGAQKHRYFLCQSMSRLMHLSAVAALSERLPLVDRIPDEELEDLFVLAQEIKHTDPGFYYELKCFYASYWFYCSSYDKEGIADLAKYVAKAVKAVVSLKDLDPGDLKKLTGDLRVKFKMLPEKWAIESLRIRGLSYADILRYVDLFLKGKEAGWFGMGYVVELARVAHSRTIDSMSAHHRLRQLACLKGKKRWQQGKKRWQLRFFACQQLMSLAGHPQCAYNEKLLQVRREKGEKHPRVLALLNGEPPYSCGEPLVALAEGELVHLLRSNRLECLYSEVISLREQMGGMRMDMQRILIGRVVDRTMRSHALRWGRAVHAVPSPPPVNSPRDVLFRPQGTHVIERQHYRLFVEAVPEAVDIPFAPEVDWKEVHSLFTELKSDKYRGGAFREYFAEPMRRIERDRGGSGWLFLPLLVPLSYTVKAVQFPLLLVSEGIERSRHNGTVEDRCHCDDCQLNRVVRMERFLRPFPDLEKLYLVKFPREAMSYRASLRSTL